MPAVSVIGETTNDTQPLTHACRFTHHTLLHDADAMLTNLHQQLAPTVGQPGSNQAMHA
jgi:hypothetical protein